MVTPARTEETCAIMDPLEWTVDVHQGAVGSTAKISPQIALD